MVVPTRSQNSSWHSLWDLRGTQAPQLRQSNNTLGGALTGDLRHCKSHRVKHQREEAHLPQEMQGYPQMYVKIRDLGLYKDISSNQHVRSARSISASGGDQTCWPERPMSQRTAGRTLGCKRSLKDRTGSGRWKPVWTVACRPHCRGPG